MLYNNPIKNIKNFIGIKQEDQTEYYSGSGASTIGIIFLVIFAIIYFIPIILAMIRYKRLPTSVLVMVFLGCIFLFGFNPIISIILILTFTDTCMTKSQS